MTASLRERINRLILRHGHDAVDDCVDAVLRMAESHDPETIRQWTRLCIDGGLVPTPPETEEKTRTGRPARPEVALMVAWCAVEAVRGEGVSINAACKRICRKLGRQSTRSHSGLVLLSSYRIGHPDTLRRIYYEAKERHDEDADFRTLAELVLPDIRSALTK